jgi:heme/copper-type cytochrome/quinol oxidase subunit 4
LHPQKQKKQAFWSSTVGFVIKVALTKLGSTIVFTDNMARHKNMEDPNQTQPIIGQ